MLRECNKTIDKQLEGWYKKDGSHLALRVSQITSFHIFFWPFILQYCWLANNLS